MLGLKFIIFKPELDSQGRRIIDEDKTENRNFFNLFLSLFYLAISAALYWGCMKLAPIIKEYSFLLQIIFYLVYTFIFIVCVFFLFCVLISLILTPGDRCGFRIILILLQKFYNSRDNKKLKKNLKISNQPNSAEKTTNEFLPK
ncbi:MAG: hypothetical protein Q8807_02385 ['Waltheria sp.' little leaf phytoplasma]|nr:hypothetical protein ['Waltheria sp.' little leaf phytoplasma]